jgi:DNA-binding beta-propeller fold protein YncE
MLLLQRAFRLAALAVVLATRAPSGNAAFARVAPPVLRQVADIPLPGPANRFDYQSIDSLTGRLYIAHMNAGTLVVFDTRTQALVADLVGFRGVHGVWAVPELHKVYASVTGAHEVAVVDALSLKVSARLGPISYPDGLAYAPTTRRIFVSDESSEGMELVIDAVADRVLGRVKLGGEAGNTVWDPVTRRILVAVQTRNEVVAIDPAGDTIVARYKIASADSPHGLSVDAQDGLLFIANEGNGTLNVVDLKTLKPISVHRVGEGPDVLAFDPGLQRLYVSAESGKLSVLEVRGRDVVMLGELDIPRAHTVAVDRATHKVYLPLENLGGRPVLRIMQP